MSSTRVWHEGPVFCSASAAPSAGSLGSASAAGGLVRPLDQIIGGNMSTKLNGFVRLPMDSYGAVRYLRVASIDAFWGDERMTYIQMRGYHNSEESCYATLGVEEALSLIAAAQNG